MKRRPKPEQVLAPGERPPCRFEWKVHPEDGHLFSAGCACGLPYSEHERYREAMHRSIASEVGIHGLRKQIDRVRIPVRERTWPLKTGVLRENGQSRRYLLDGEAIDGDDPVE